MNMIQQDKLGINIYIPRTYTETRTLTRSADKKDVIRTTRTPRSLNDLFVELKEVVNSNPSDAKTLVMVKGLANCQNLLAFWNALKLACSRVAPVDQKDQKPFLSDLVVNHKEVEGSEGFYTAMSAEFFVTVMPSSDAFLRASKGFIKRLDDVKEASDVLQKGAA